MAEFNRLRQAVLSNDWDTIASLSYLLVSTSVKFTETINAALVRQDIAMIRLVYGRFRDISPFAAYSMGFVMCHGNFKMAVILDRLGYIVRERDIRLLVQSSKNLRFIDWAVKKCKPPPKEGFIDFHYAHITSKNILQYLAYRSFLPKYYMDEEAVNRMMNVLQEGFDDLPKELIHEICEYLFLCSRSSQ